MKVPSLFCSKSFSCAVGILLAVVNPFSQLLSQSWNPVAGGTSGYVSAMYSDTSTNSLYVGGSFDTSGTTYTSNVSRWDGNSWNSVGTGLSGIVLQFEKYNGELFAGCDNGAAPGNIFTWNGTSWAMVGGGTNASVSAMTVYNGELYVGGAFDTAGAVAASYIAKWNGASWTSVGIGMNDEVNALTVFNGELYAGGKFTLAGGNAANGVAKWNGNAWTTVGTGTGKKVYSLMEYNGELFEGGMNASGTAEVMRWDGINWVAFDGGVQGGLGSYVSSMIVYNSELYVGGTILSAGVTMITTNGIAKWNGTNWSAVGNGMDNGVLALDTLNGALYAGGYFLNADNNSAKHIAVWPDPVFVPDHVNSTYQLTLFPNPSQEVVTFQFTGVSVEREYVIYDATGRVQWQEHSALSSFSIPVLQMADGIYFYGILDESGVSATGKFIVAH